MDSTPCLLLLTRMYMMKYAGVIKVLGVIAALQQTLFIVSGSPSIPMLEGGDLNVMLGVIKVLGVNAASQQTLFIVSAPHPSNTRGS